MRKHLVRFIKFLIVKAVVLVWERDGATVDIIVKRRIEVR